MKSISNPPLMNLAHGINLFFRKHPLKGAYRFTKFISKLLLSAPEKIKIPQIIHTYSGLNFWIEHLIEPGVEKELYYHGIYEAGTLHVLKSCLQPGDCFMDIGSNVGLMTVVAAQQVGPTGVVYAFEPEPRVSAILTKNIEINALQNVRVNNFALGSVPGNLMLYPQDEISLGSATLTNNAPQAATGINVKVETLDNFLNKNNITKIKMLKIDVEGWELEVLKGARQLLARSVAPILCVEYSRLSHKDTHTEDIYDFLGSINKYRIFKLKKTKEWISKLVEINNRTGLPDHDNLFCFLPSQLAKLPKTIFDN